jgi:hypothetical protein
MLYLIFLLHFIGDFGLQHRWLAENKSKNNLALALHCLIYGATLFAGLYFFMPPAVPLQIFALFIFFNVSAHLMTDAITSRITSFFWSKQQVYLFFVTIGFDQLIHSATLLLSYQVFLESTIGKQWPVG